MKWQILFQELSKVVSYDVNRLAVDWLPKLMYVHILQLSVAVSFPK